MKKLFLSLAVLSFVALSCTGIPQTNTSDNPQENQDPENRPDGPNNPVN